MEKISVKKAKIEDAQTIYDLIYELAVFEKEPHAVSNTVALIEQDGFGEKPLFDCILALNNEEKVVGMALYYTTYSTWKGKMIHLEDLIVREKYRGKGFGKQLLEAFLSICAHNEAKVVKWEVLNWNTDAIEFYKKYDVKFDNEWSQCKLYADQLVAYSSLK